MTKEFKINIPEGYEIDKEYSTFECIKFKPVAKSWRNGNPEVTGYFIMGNRIEHLPTASHAKWGNSSNYYDVYATEKQAKSALAMAQISQIMANDKRFGGPVTDEEWNDSTNVYTIERINGTYTTPKRSDFHSFLAFHTREQRYLFIKENEDLIKDYLMID